MNITNAEIDSLIKSSIEPSIVSKIKEWRQESVQMKEIKNKYEIRAGWFENKHGYRTAFFDVVLNALNLINEDYVCVLSIDFNNEDSGFGFIYDNKILFFSGPLKKIKQNWGE